MTSQPYYVPAHKRLDQVSRLEKFEKIRAVLGDYVDLGASDVLEIGTSAGHIAAALSQHARSVTSVDINDERVVKDGYTFRRTADATLPVEDAGFDVAVSNHVIEHIPKQRTHLEEIWRALKDDGVAYLATPNKYWVMEPHFKLPFLSWLPRPLSRRYLRLAKGTEWNVYPLSYRRLSRLVAGRFRMTDKTVDVLHRPDRYGLKMPPWMRVLSRVPRPLLRLARPFVPSYIIVLTKAGRGSR